MNQSIHILSLAVILVRVGAVEHNITNIKSGHPPDERVLTWPMLTGGTLGVRFRVMGETEILPPVFSP